MTLFKKSVLAAGLAASAFATTTPAMARDYYYHGNDDTAAIAIGAGILGLAVGAIAASSDRDDRYYDGGYYGSAYAPGWSFRDGYYWNHDGQRFSRDEYFRRNPAFDHRGHLGDYRRGFDHDRGDFRRGY